MVDTCNRSDRQQTPTYCNDCLLTEKQRAGLLTTTQITSTNGLKMAHFANRPGEDSYEDFTFFDPHDVGGGTREVFLDTGLPEYTTFSVWDIKDDAGSIALTSTKYFGPYERGYIHTIARFKLDPVPDPGMLGNALDFGFWDVSAVNGIHCSLSNVPVNSLMFETVDALGQEQTFGIVCDLTEYHTFEIKLKVGHAYFYIDGVEVAHHTTHIDISLGFFTYNTNAAWMGVLGDKYLYYDYIHIIQGVPF